MTKDIVVGIDSSTQSTKAIAWTKDGTNVAEGRSPIRLFGEESGAFEQNTEDWWISCRKSLQELTKKIDKKRIAGISISNQRETIGFLDGNGEAISPAILWMDSRCSAQVNNVVEALGQELIHETTGLPIDKTPALYKLAWTKKVRPEIFEQTRRFVDVQTFLVWKLSGNFHTSWASAGPSGYFNIHEKKWSKPILDFLGIDESQLPLAFPLGEQIGKISAEASREAGLEEGTPIFAGGGDGQCAGLGVNCVAPGKAYVNLGTAVVAGVWNPEFKAHKAWRTLVAAQGEGFIFESCLITGAFLVNWYVNQFIAGDDQSKKFLEKMESTLKDVPVGTYGLITLPFWEGVMNPYWEKDAVGCMVGFKGYHKPEHVYRSILEGICLHNAQAFDYMSQANVETDHYVAIGGGASSSLWTKMLADSTNRRVNLSNTNEASSLGAGMLAAKGAGWFNTIQEASDKMKSPITKSISPDPKEHDKWRDLLSIYTNAYSQVSSIFSQIVKFNLKHGG